MTNKEKIMEHVYADVTELMEYSIAAHDSLAPISFRDINHLQYICPECGHTDQFVKTEFGKLQAVFDEQTGYYVCPVCLDEYPTRQEATECCIAVCDADDTCYQCKNCASVFETLDDLDELLPDRQEWWVVSEPLYDALNTMSELTVSVNDMHYWCSREAGVPLLSKRNLGLALLLI